MKNHTCVWRNIYNTARATHSRYYKYFAKHACDFSLILLEPCNFLYLGTGHKVEGGVGYEKLGVGHYFSTRRKGWVRKIYALH